ncbi:MAG: ABC transporter ATP-binding protein [Brevinematales bacterium]|nr:ABC transporter ATP-binding protein [Brevinematales bacterium]
MVEIKDLDFSYGNIPALRGVNLTIDAGDFVGIIGPNGGGKTTLLRLMLGLIDPDGGTVRIGGMTPRRARGLIGYVPQTPHIEAGFPMRVREATAMGLMTSRAFFPRFTRAEWEQVNRALEMTGIAALADRGYGELSGGQRQRVLIARAMVSQPKLILMDEPTAQVDTSAEKSIMELLAELNRNGITIALVSHDVGFITTFVTRVICVNREVHQHLCSEILPEDVAHELYNSHTAPIGHHSHGGEI